MVNQMLTSHVTPLEQGRQASAGSKFKLATIVLVYRQTLKLLSVLADNDFAVYYIHKIIGTGTTIVQALSRLQDAACM
jgi:hypothetical protein